MLVLTMPGDELQLKLIEGYFMIRMKNARKLLALPEDAEGGYIFEVLLLCCCALDALGNLFLKDD